MKRVPELPDSYTNIKPAHFTHKSSPPPTVTGAGMSLPDMEMLKPQLALEFELLQKVSVTEVYDSVTLTRSSRHADKKRSLAFKACISSLARSTSFCGHSATCHGQDQRCSEVAEPRTSACDRSRSADVYYSRADPVAVA